MNALATRVAAERTVPGFTRYSELFGQSSEKRAHDEASDAPPAAPKKRKGHGP